jgi:hypothetical protein
MCTPLTIVECCGIQIEVEEEFITNKLMKRLEALKKEKQVSVPSPFT